MKSIFNSRNYCCFVELFLLSLIFFCSCSRTPSNLFMDGAPVRMAETHFDRCVLDPVHEYSSDSLMGASNIFAVDDANLATRFDSRPYFYKLLSLPEVSLSDPFLMMGRGPNETRSAAGLHIRYEGREVLDILTTDGIYSYFLDDLLDNKLSPFENNDYHDFVKDGLCMLAHNSSRGMFCRVVGNDDFSYRMISYKDSTQAGVYHVFGQNKELISRHVLKQLSHAAAVKPDGTRAVLLMYHFDKANFLDLTGDDNFTVCFNGASPKPDLMELKKDSAQLGDYYLSLNCDDDYIYAWCSTQGYPREYDGITGCFLRIMDWEGKAVAEYFFKQDLKCVTVAPGRTKLFGLSLDEHVFEYDLP